MESECALAMKTTQAGASSGRGRAGERLGAAWEGRTAPLCTGSTAAIPRKQPDRLFFLIF